MYNLDQFTHKQIKVRRTFMKVCEWLGPGYTSINSGINACKKKKLPLGIPSTGNTHTYIPLMCVGHE